MTDSHIPAHHSGLARLADWLAEYAPATGLLGYDSSDAILENAVLPAKVLPELLGGPLIGDWADLGAGSGALGLALAILCPASNLTLVDRRKRASDFSELAAKRLRIANVQTRTLDLRPGEDGPRFAGTCLRAVTETRAALAIAAGISRRWICAWHAPSLIAYDCPPEGFLIASRSGVLAPNLIATLYARR